MLKKRIYGAGVVSACAIAAATGVALADGDGSASNAARPQVSALHQPVSQRDAMAPGLIAQINDAPGAIAHEGVDWTQARRTAPNVWLVSAGDKLCIHEGTAGAGAVACGPLSGVGSADALIEQEVAGEGTTLTGVVPDGVDAVAVEQANGSKRNVPVSNNTYTLSTDSPPNAVSFDDAAGAHRQSLK